MKGPSYSELSTFSDLLSELLAHFKDIKDFQVPQNRYLVFLRISTLYKQNNNCVHYHKQVFYFYFYL